jgi:hypothetical protein
MPPSNERKIPPWIAHSLLFFDNEPKAHEGKRALIELASKGSISLYRYAVLAKKADATATIKQGDDMAPLGMWLIRHGCREGNKYG